MSNLRLLLTIIMVSTICCLNMGLGASYTYVCNSTASCDPVSGMCLNGQITVLETQRQYSSQTEDPDGSIGGIPFQAISFMGGPGDVEIFCLFLTPQNNMVKYIFQPEECLGKNPYCNLNGNSIVCTCDSKRTAR